MADTSHRISPTGILDGRQGDAVLAQVREALDRGVTSIEVDMNAVSFMDSAGFGILVAALKQAKAAGGHLRLTNVNSQVRLVLEITGTDSILMMLDDKDVNR